jgi:hypothetical protein
MAEKIIRDYVPGQNDFLHFAEVMNKNAAIDLQRNRTQGAVMPAVQQTPEALSGPAALERIQQNFKAMGGKI